MKFHFIAAHRQAFRLRSLCRVLGVSRSGYYAWCGRPAPRRAERNDALLVHIRAAYQRGRQTYGAPRVHQELVQQGVLGCISGLGATDHRKLEVSCQSSS